MHTTSYQPSRSQQLWMQQLIKERYSADVVIVHHVLMNTPLRLYVQAELHQETPRGKFITFPRIEL